MTACSYCSEPADCAGVVVDADGAVAGAVAAAAGAGWVCAADGVVAVGGRTTGDSKMSAWI
jgi:hypothetical protein